MRYLNNQQGIASLLGVTLAGILMTILIVSMSSLMVGELRRAIDGENGVKAYYAAQGGVEEAEAAVVQALSNGTSGRLDSLIGQSCSDPLNSHFSSTYSSSDATTPVTITCREITTNGELEGRVDKNGSRQVDLSFIQALVGGISRVELQWDQTETPSQLEFTEPLLSGGTATTNNSIDTQSPPVLEVSSSWYKPGTVGGADLATGLYAMLLIPAPNSGATTLNGRNKVASVNMSNAPTSPPSSSIARISCAQSGNYRCKVDLTNLVPAAGYSSVLHIQPRFKAANLIARFYGNDGQEYGVPLDLATLDVTARVGDSFRRVQQTIPIRSTPASTVDTAIYGDYSVCKDLDVFTGPGGYLVPHELNCRLSDPSPVR